MKKEQIKILEKKISAMFILSRMQKISVLIVIGVVLGAGIIPIMNGYQIQTVVTKNNHIEMNTATKITSEKLQEQNKNDISFTESTGIMNGTWKTLFYKNKLASQNFVADSSLYDNFPVTKYLFTSNFFTSYLFTSNLFANNVKNSYHFDLYYFIKPFLKHTQTTPSIPTQAIPPETTQITPPETTQTTSPVSTQAAPPTATYKTPEKTTQSSTTSLSSSAKIVNSKGNSWPASGKNIQIAIDNLNGPGEVWLPAATLDVDKNIYIYRPGTKIHGQGSSKTIIVFHNARLISSKNADSSSDTKNFQSGLDNIQLDNFKFTGNGNLELTLGKNTQLYNINGENVTCDRPGAFRFIIPTGTKYAYNLMVTNCRTYKTHWHGFFINALTSYSTIENVKFTACAAKYAGWPYPAENKWSVGFHLCEYYGSSKQGDMTIKNVMIKDCTAEYNWESGFHFEVRPNKINVTLDHCIAQYNGQKFYYYKESYPYMSGFMGLLKDITLRNCISNYNTHVGYKGSTATGFKPAVFINCVGKGNFDSLSDHCTL